jgi:hypothetical protein
VDRALPDIGRLDTGQLEGAGERAAVAANGAEREPRIVDRQHDKAAGRSGDGDGVQRVGSTFQAWEDREGAGAGEARADCGEEREAVRRRPLGAHSLAGSIGEDAGQGLRGRPAGDERYARLRGAPPDRLGTCRQPFHRRASPNPAAA